MQTMDSTQDAGFRCLWRFIWLGFFSPNPPQQDVILVVTGGSIPNYTTRVAIFPQKPWISWFMPQKVGCVGTHIGHQHMWKDLILKYSDLWCQQVRLAVWWLEKEVNLNDFMVPPQKHCDSIILYTLPETNMFAPENWWLQYCAFFLGKRAYFQGFRECL